MYVCICNAVTDSDIRGAVEGGVRNMRQLAKETGCSSNCARCVDTATEVLEEALVERNGFLQVFPSLNAA